MKIWIIEGQIIQALPYISERKHVTQLEIGRPVDSRCE